MLGVFLDTETTGLDPAIHHPIEIALRVKRLSDGGEVCAFTRTIWWGDTAWSKRDHRAIEVNGFDYDELLNHGVKAADVREELILLLHQHSISFRNAVFICQNPSFDKAFLSLVVSANTQVDNRWPYIWLDMASMFLVRLIGDIRTNNTPVKDRYRMSKDAIAEYYGIPGEQKPHRAMNGVDHLIACYTQVVGFPTTPHVENGG